MGLGLCDSFCSVFGIIAIAATIYFVIVPYMRNRKMKKILEKWNNTPKDLVIMHAIRRAKTVSHPSPFVVKLETFLRMAKIPYKANLGLTDAWGPKGRFPWISINGEHIGDSELIIDFLKKKFDVNLSGKYKKEELAMGKTCAIMMDHHFFWGLVLYRFVFGSFQNLIKTTSNKVNPYRIQIFRWYAGWAFSRRSKGHGIGLHSQKEIENLTLADLETLSDFLGTKKFLLGDEPTEYDCTVFGHLAQARWALPGSIYENSLMHDFPNLREYCERMKTTFYPDWNDLLEK